jgi:diguanylate cyclase (GGDEF)-like protein/PAS domain S-box-containing protein
MLDALPEMVNRFRVADLTITYCNQAWAAQYDVTPAQAVGQRLDRFLTQDELAGLRAQLANLGPDRPVIADSVPRSSHSSTGQWVAWVDRYLVGPTGPEVLSVGRDVTERHTAELALAASEARFRTLAERASDIVWNVVVDPVPRFDYVSPSVEVILGHPPSYFLDDFQRFLDLLDDTGRNAIERTLNGERTLDEIDFHIRHANGSIVICETRTAPVPTGLQGVSRDVTELRRLQETLAAHALRDPLTGLANRRLLDELLDTELARARRTGTPLAVAYIDVDGLKQVNDVHGHDAGDLVLRETARRLLKAVRGADVVARIGGDEFVVVYQPDDPSADHLVDRIDALLAEPIEIGRAGALHCPASIGTADSRTVGMSPERLLAAADDAMYQVKRERRSRPRPGVTGT